MGWIAAFLAGTAALCIAYWLAARKNPELRLPRNFALLMLASCIASNLIAWGLPYPEGIILYAPMDLGLFCVALIYRKRGRWVRAFAWAELAMLTLHAALWGPHIKGDLPGTIELGRYFVILDVFYVIALLIVGFPGGRYAVVGIRATLSRHRRAALQPISRG